MDAGSVWEGESRLAIRFEGQAKTNAMSLLIISSVEPDFKSLYRDPSGFQRQGWRGTSILKGLPKGRKVSSGRGRLNAKFGQKWQTRAEYGTQKETGSARYRHHWPLKSLALVWRG
jgi:hypothetical protein